MKKTPDFTYTDEGTIIFLRPLSKKAATWVNDNLNIAQWQSVTSIEIEPRLFQDIEGAIVRDGLSIEKY